MLRFKILAICLLQIAAEVFGDGYYSVIGPGTLHSGHKYSVAVAAHNTTEPSSLNVDITGPSYNETKTVHLNQTDVVKLVHFDVPVLEKGTYNLTVKGLAGIDFYNTTKLNFGRFKPHFLIQTDKGTYKPGDEVQYRVIALDENLKPAHPSENTLVVVEDSKSNRLKEIKDLRFVNGVHTGKFLISEYPALGTWRLMVSTDGTMEQINSFSVEKYVLPKYEVKVETNERVSVKDGDMQAVVRANYTYGKPVNGKVTLLVRVQNYYFISNEKENNVNTPSIVRTADMVNGKAKFDFSVKEYETKIKKDYPAWLEVTAVVEEEFTGVKLNSTAHSKLFPYRYQIKCRNFETCYFYHPEKEQEVVISIRRVDGSMLQDTKSIVRLTYVETYDELLWSHKKNESVELTKERLHFEFESHLNASSQAVFNVKLPDLPEVKGYRHTFEGTVKYADETQEVVSGLPIRKSKEEPITISEEPKDYLRIDVNYEDEKYSLREDVESSFTVNSSTPLSYYVYTIVGRGNVLESKRVDLPEPQKVSVVKFVPTFEMAPYANIYVYYVDNGEYRYTEASAYIEWSFKNKITIDAPDEVKVGDEVSLSIRTEPNSFVGLLAVDQSVLLLAENNTIDEEQERWRLGSYSTFTPDQGGYSIYPGERSGVVTLTNAPYFYNYTKPEWGLPILLAPRGILTDHVDVPKIIHLSPNPEIVSEGLGAGGSSAQYNQPAVRKDFAETWIFTNIEKTESENFTFVKKIPDTITSWVVSGFSLNPEKGLATTKESKKIKAFQPFFVSVRLPYSVIRGEVISVPALVFNYLSKDLDVEVTLDNTDGEFEFSGLSNEVIDVEKRSKTVRVSANSAAGVSFMVRPKIIGNILLKITAISPLAGDAIHKSLKVVPEGVTEYANRAFFMNLKDQPEANSTFQLELPPNFVPDSVHAEFSVVGDLLGPLLNNLDYLVRLPTGCGEQTMSKLVPNYLIMRYLNSTGRLNSGLEDRIKLNLERGYQNLLRFQHKDGSFSSFGPSNSEEDPRNGSTWLTAYVLRFLPRMIEYIHIDPKVINDGLKFLNERQAANGSFTEAGDFFYQSQRNEVSLTATVCLALLENQNTSNINVQMNKGLEFIAENMQKVQDLSIKFLAAFTLQKANHPTALEKFNELRSLAKTDGDRRWWSSERNTSQITGCCWWRWPRSNEIETTSYALLTLLSHESPRSEEVLQIIKWLVAQRNSYGGFASTQDTIVGLQALIRFAELSSYVAANMDVDFKTLGGVREKQEALKLNEENALLMQSFELPANTSAVEFHGRGSGAALIQISYQYNVLQKEPAPSFTLSTVLNKDVPPYKLVMDVCVEWVGEGPESNMAVVEVTLPSGYETNSDIFGDLRKVDRVRHTESKNSDTTIVIYFESLKKEALICLPIEAFKAHDVALQKPAPVVAYDYYDTSKKATTYYKVASKICDICDKREEECMKVCS